jgi:predicted DNA-binding transcriptional regulator AlpA
MARPEVTGKKPANTNDGPKYRRRPVSADPNSLAMSIREFCRLHGISEDQFYKMKREGWGPIKMKVGSRTLISHEAAAEWRKAREAAA